ncbi:MAG: hypothetical protein VW338_01130, partial [Rhodospirillaceae bacterium]
VVLGNPVLLAARFDDCEHVRLEIPNNKKSRITTMLPAHFRAAPRCEVGNIAISRGLSTAREAQEIRPNRLAGPAPFVYFPRGSDGTPSATEI